MNHFALGRRLTMLVLAALALAGSVPAAPANAAGCRFVLGFATLAAALPNQVGLCVEEESHASNGDALQHTSTAGLLVWRKADNWTAFTDGFRSWVNGPEGLRQRLNTERFPWEADAIGLAAIEAAPVLGAKEPPFNLGPDGRFGGIQFSDVKLDVAKDLGLSWTRELFLFNILESFNPARFNSISTDQNMPPNVLREVGLVQFFPRYCNGGRDKLAPCGPDQWAQFMGALAKAKQGRVQDWVLSNEQDICSPEHLGFSWDSPNRVADYQAYLKAGYQAIKASAPAAQVIFGTLSLVNSACQTDGTEMTFWNQWLKLAAADPASAANNWWFDQLSLNIHKEPEKIYDLLRRYHESMVSMGFDKPVWVMELGIPVRPDPIDPRSNADLAVNKDNQLSFLIQAYANAIAGGADHIGIYKMSDYPASDPAYKTIKTAVKYMSNVTSAVKTPDNRQRYVNRQDGVVSISLRGPGFETVVAYNRGLSPRQITIPATSNVAMVADKYGNERRVTATNGSYTLQLDPVNAWYDAPWGERVRFIGGSPVLLRQAA